MAPLMVAHGLPALRQELPSLPPVATYHGPAARATPVIRTITISVAKARTVIADHDLEWVIISFLLNHGLSIFGYSMERLDVIGRQPMLNLDGSCCEAATPPRVIAARTARGP